MEKRTILAILLSAAVWVAWYAIFGPNQKPVKQPQTVAEKKIEKKAPAAEDTLSRPAIPAARIFVTGSRAGEKKISIKTDLFSAVLSTKGASISEFTDLERNIKLTCEKGPFNTRGDFDFSIHFNESEFLDGNALNDSNWAYTREKDSVRFYTTIRYNGRPLRLEKKYIFNRDSHYFTLQYRLTNQGGRTLSFRSNPLILSPGDSLGPELDYENRYNMLSSIYYLNDDYEQGRKGGGVFSKGGALKRETGTTNWVGIMSRYYLLIMKAQDFNGSGVVFDSRQNTGFRTGMLLQVPEIAPRASITRSFQVYIGEKNKDKLASVDRILVDASDVSKWIEPIRYFVMWCLLGINSLFGNLGWSLVIFSILTKVVFLPLTQKSTESMKKMQELQPKMNELKAKFKDKPEELQKETMKLYKENKVNPMGGCLPLLLQMPFFFALYSALINSVELWQSPFIFWIKDLSMPDTIFTVSGFDMNILPLVMTASTFIQQKLTTSDVGQQQKMMMYVMPLVLLFIFWNMPSGLVLYWALQNIFQILHQLIITRFSKKEAK